MIVVSIAYAQTGHLRQTVETSPLARQLLTNDTASAMLTLIGLGNGVVSNGIASYSTTNGNAVSGSIVISGSGFTNTLSLVIKGYFTATNAASFLTNVDNAGNPWSTNSAGTNIYFEVQPNGAIRTIANAIDTNKWAWHSW